MKNIHKIFADWNDIQILILKKYGIEVEEGYDSFTLEENESFWDIKPYLDKWKVSDTVISTFSRDDLNSANRLIIKGTWVNGYPMPDNDAGYLNTTYDDKDYCGKCGMGLIQKEPFRLRKQPKWGTQKMFSLSWIYDELFVSSGFYEEVLKKYSIEATPVLLYKKDAAIKDTLQLKIPVIDVFLDLGKYDYEICKICERERYNLINEGFFPPFLNSINGLDIFKCKEWFGTGANARKYIFISKELREEFIKQKIKAAYTPCS